MWRTQLRLPFWQGPTSQDTTNEQLRKIEDYRPGYPRFTALISAYDRYFVCRRFDQVRARLLLSKQDQLSILEQQLEQVDREEPAALFLGRSRSDANQARIDLLAQLDSCLADYDNFVERSSRLLALDHAQERDIEALQNWTEGTGSIAREETEYLTHSQELVCLAPVQDNAILQLENWAENMIIRFFNRNHTGYHHSVSTDPNIYIHPGTLINRCARGFLLFLFILLLLMPVLMCNIVSTTSSRIAIVIVYTILYLLILAGLTKARTIELIVAGATYATVLVVFVSGTSTTGSPLSSNT